MMKGVICRNDCDMYLDAATGFCRRVCAIGLCAYGKVVCKKIGVGHRWAMRCTIRELTLYRRHLGGGDGQR